MEFQGRVKKILPARSGVSQRTGNEWKSLPFIFEYFEHDTDHYAESVVLETFDTKVIEHLKEGMEVICGFGHRTREYDGKFYNELRMYKIESVKKAQQANSPQPPQNAASGQALAPFPPQTDNNSTPINNNGDDLPF